MTPHAKNIPYGYCHCSCGQKTRIAPKTSSRDGAVKGIPYLFLRGHCGRKVPNPYLREDRGWTTPCWVWQWSKNRKGYGIAARSIAAYILYWTEVKGPVPLGLELHHLCEVKACVNPDHLTPVTRQEHARLTYSPENVLRRRAKITHCPNGHEYTAENSLYRRGRSPAGIPRRTCRICENASIRIRYAKRRNKAA